MVISCFLLRRKTDEIPAFLRAESHRLTAFEGRRITDEIKRRRTTEENERIFPLKIFFLSRWNHGVACLNEPTNLVLQTIRERPPPRSYLLDRVCKFQQNLVFRRQSPRKSFIERFFSVLAYLSSIMNATFDRAMFYRSRQGREENRKISKSPIIKTSLPRRNCSLATSKNSRRCKS